MSWRDEAACKGMDPSLFFAEKGSYAPVAVREAKKVCAGCPVRQSCAEDAIDNGYRFGVWGGLTPKERRAFGRARRRTPGLKLPDAPQFIGDPRQNVHKRVKRAKHGTRSKYVAGCRCDPCRDAERAYWYVKKLRRKSA